MSHRARLRVGFVPMLDCAPVIIAAELGLFEKYGAPVEITREAGWATVREKLLHGEIEAAHAPASMAFAIHCGIGVVARPCLTAMVLNLNGSFITLTNELWEKGVRDAASLKKLIESERGGRKRVFASVLKLSSQSFLLRKWLRSGGIDPDRDVELVVVPSRLVHENLSSHYLDGYCVAEPWSSILTMERKAWTVASSHDIAPYHPEKVFLVLQEFADRHSELHLAMIAALIEACAFCDDPANRRELARILSQPKYLEIPPAVLENTLLGKFDTGRITEPIPEAIVYQSHDANVPSRRKAKWVYDEIVRNEMAVNCPSFRPDILRKLFREDIYHQAREMTLKTAVQWESVPRSAAPSPKKRRLPEARLSFASTWQLTSSAA